MHGFGVAQAREGFWQIGIDRFLEDGAQEIFHDPGDFRFVEEGGFNINLGEFGLTIGAQILIAEALGDLVVTVEAGNHQQLLEKLR